MALADSKQAIGAVSKLLKGQLAAGTSATTVDVGWPGAAASTGGPKLNLFLYQVDMDAHLRNHPLDQGQVPPLWLVLRYLLTAFDDDKDSDSADAHDLLGEGMLALRELNFLTPAVTNTALADNPEPLKITFDAADTELLSKIMQGTDERYRLSAAVQVRPVMIASSAPPHYSLAVKSVGPPANEGVVVLPSLGPRLERLAPKRFEAGQEIILTGHDIGGDIREICIGSLCLSVTARKTGQVKTTLPPDIALSVGSYPVFVRGLLPSGRYLTSNALLGHLLPTLSTASTIGLTSVGSNVFGTLNLTGVRLGGETDDIFVAFYREGGVALMAEANGTVSQSTLTVSVSSENAIPAGRYHIIVRTNGEQAVNSPEVDWT